MNASSNNVSLAMDAIDASGSSVESTTGSTSSSSAVVVYVPPGTGLSFSDIVDRVSKSPQCSSLVSSLRVQRQPACGNSVCEYGEPCTTAQCSTLPQCVSDCPWTAFTVTEKTSATCPNRCRVTARASQVKPEVRSARGWLSCGWKA
jgi:hypothetical protein